MHTSSLIPVRSIKMSSYGQDPEDGLRAQRAPVFVTPPIVPY